MAMSDSQKRLIVQGILESLSTGTKVYIIDSEADYLSEINNNGGNNNEIRHSEG